MSDNLGTCLNKVAVSFNKKLSIGELLPHLSAHGLLTDGEIEYLESNATSQSKAQYLNSRLKRKGSGTLQKILCCLMSEERHSGHRDIEEELRKLMLDRAVVMECPHTDCKPRPLVNQPSPIPAASSDGQAAQQQSEDQLSTYNIFISYGREVINNKFARNLFEILERENFAVFLDTESIKVGEKLSNKLSQGVQACDAFIVIFSGKYNKSDWCKRELEVARDSEKLILPIRRENKEYLKEVLIHLVGIKYLDFFAGDDISDDPQHFAQAFGELMDCLNKKAAEKQKKNELVT